MHQERERERERGRKRERWSRGREPERERARQKDIGAERRPTQSWTLQLDSTVAKKNARNMPFEIFLTRTFC